MIIDFHTHILPGIDDGSRDIDMTIRMLEAERDQGVSHIYATPHFYAHRRPIEYFLERRAAALDLVAGVLEIRPDLPRVTPGAEVYYFSGMGRAEKLADLCIEGTDLLLLEMPFAQWHSDVVKDVEDIIHKRGLRVILAHVERYERYQKDRSAWNRILDMPLTIQLNTEPFINTGSLLKPNKEHKSCMRLLSEHDNCIIGTDCHNLTNRAPNLEEARKAIEKKVGKERLLQIDAYTEELVRV